LVEVKVASAPRSAGAEDARKQAGDIAIVGMSCVFPGILNLADFWRNVALGIGHEKTAHEELEQRSVSRLLAAALRDARVGRPSGADDATSPEARMVLAVSGMSAVDAASAFPFSGARPDVVASTSTVNAIDSVLGHLRSLTCDVGVVAGVELPGGLGLGSASPVRPYTASSHGSPASQGCGAVVLKRQCDAERDGDRIYALIAGTGLSSDRTTALRTAYARSGIDPATVSLIEGGGAATAAADAEELAALHDVLGRPGFPEVALGASSSIIGAAGHAAAVAGLIKAALAIYHRTLPPTLGAEKPHQDIQNSRLYVHAKLRPWISPTGVRRRAGVNMAGFSGLHGHVVLEENAAEPKQAWQSLTPWPSEMIVIAAATREALHEEVRRVQRLAAQGPAGGSLGDLAFTLATCFSDSHRFRVTTVARDAIDLSTRLAAVDQRLTNDTTDAWKNFAGTYFGSGSSSGKVGFLFPGVGFPGLAGGYADRIGELALHFPAILDWLDRAEAVCAEDEVAYKLSFQLFPPPYCDLATLAEIEEQLKWSQRASIGTMIANLATYSLVRALGIRADAMAGFSLGEWSALVAAGIIDMETAASTAQAPAESSALLQINDSYRGSWAMVSASAEDIEAVIQPLGDEVAVTIDVSPDQAFIGGEEAAVGVAIERLRTASIWASAVPSSPLMASFSAFHTKHAAPYSGQLRETLSAMPLKRLEADIYSSVTARLFPPEPQKIIEILSQNVTGAVRVRETIATMHKHGIRIFLQLGGGGRLLPTVQKNLALEPHIALSIDVEYLSGLEQLQYVLAQLLAMGVSFDPLSLYQHRLLGQLDLDAVPSAPSADRPSTDDLPMPLGGVPVAAWLAELLEIDRRADRTLSELLTRFLDHARAHLPSAPERAAQPLRPSPMLGEVVEAEPGKTLRSRLVLDMAVHHFLGDHVLLAVPGPLKPARDLLPTLPFAFAIEVMSQAAQALFPELSVLDCHDVEAISWISLKHADTLALIIVAERIAESEVQIDIRIEGEAKPAMRGRVAMGRLPEPPPPRAFPCETGCPLSAADYYDRGPLFQGPLFRAITALHAMSADAVSGEVVLRDPRNLFAGDCPAPIFDPILLDSAAQMMGVPAWVKDQRFLVPIRAKRISRYGFLPPPGVRAQARIGYRRLDERRVQGDFDIVGPTGDLLLRVEGWEEIWVIWPKCLLQRNHRPQEGSIGHPWDVGDSTLSCYRARRLDLGDVDPAWIARYYLTPSEWEEYLRMPHLDWLLGRIAAKDCVRDWFRRHRSVVLHPLEVELATLSDGAMLLSPGDGPSSIAVAHLADEAVAVASGTEAVGVDIASMAGRDAGSFSFAFNRQEMACLPPAEPERTAWASRAWCAKKASAKACGHGDEALPRFIVQRVRPADGVVEILNEPHDLVIEVATLIDGDHAMALSTTRRLSALAPVFS